MKFGANMLSAWFGLIMVIVVLAGAFAFTFTDVMEDRLFGARRMVFIFILLAYAVYRSFRIYHILKQSRNEQ